MFRQFMARLTAKLQRFMAGRYGTDRLNMTILGIGLAACLISPFFHRPLINLLLTALSYGLGHLPQPVPEYLCPVSGEPEIPPVLRPPAGPAAPLLRLPQVPPGGPCSPGQGQDRHHLPQVPGEIYSENVTFTAASNDAAV